MWNNRASAHDQAKPIMPLLLTTGDAIGLLDRLIEKFGHRLVAPNSTEEKDFSVEMKLPQIKPGTFVNPYTLVNGESDEAYRERVDKAHEMERLGADISAAKYPQRLKVRHERKPSVRKILHELKERLELRAYDTSYRLQQADIARLVIDLLKHGSSDDEGYLADHSEPPSSYKNEQPVGSYCFWTTGYHGDTFINQLLDESHLLEGYQLRPLAQIIDELRNSARPKEKEHVSVLALFQGYNIKAAPKRIELADQTTTEIIQALKESNVFKTDYYYGDVIETGKPIQSISDYQSLSNEFYQTFETKVIQPLREEKERAQESLFTKVGRWF